MAESETRALVKLAAADVNRPEGLTVDQLDAALHDLKNQLSLKNLEPGLDGLLSRTIEDSLRPIGASLDPRISADQARTWRKALLLKLSDIPGPVLVKAARQAVHERFNFFNEVEPAIAKLAADMLTRQRGLAMRLERWKAELERAAAPQPALAPPPEPATEEEVEELNQSLAALGMKTRFRIGESGEAEIAAPPSEERSNQPEPE